MTRLELRNLKPELVIGYLVEELGGEATAPPGLVRGAGWIVRLTAGEPALVGRLRVPVLFVDVEGPNEAVAAAFLRRKTMRGGG